MIRSILNVIGFQVTWWSLVLSASNGLEPLGWAVAVAYLVAHFQWALVPGEHLREAKLVGGVALAGWTVENLMQATGVVRFIGSEIAPVWLLFMWLAFAATLRHSFRGILSRPILAAPLGAVFGPVSYLAGIPFGLLEFPNLPLGLGLYGVLWAGALVGISVLMRRWAL